MLQYVTNSGPTCIFRTNKDASNFKLITIDFDNPHPTSWKTLVEEHEKDVLEWAHAVNENYLILSYIHDVKVI